MKRILTVATSEFLSLIQTKFFIIGLLMMPVLVGASITFQVMAAKRVDRVEREFAVLDDTGSLYDQLATAAAARNDRMGSGENQKGPRFVPRPIDLSGRTLDEARVAASADVKRKTLFAFVEIPKGIFDPDAKESIEYFTDTPSVSDLPDWLETTLSKAITERRFRDAGIDGGQVDRLSKRVDVSRLGLVERKADGTVAAARKVDPLVTFALPFALMYLLFISVMATGPQLFNAVIEEKMTKISEVLIASVTPFELMMGKLIGTGSVSAVLAIVYLGGGVYTLLSTGRIELLDPVLLAWFMLFLVCTVLMFGSIFLSIGAAASDIKDAQGMMQPAMILILLPVVASSIVIRAPDSGVAIGASLFPTSAPFIMLIRLAMKPGPPLWQIFASVTIMLATAGLFVWAAGRIFRVGLLMQGKGATLAEMIRWIRA
jgi:ABC-2 type transport system permease protein